MAQAMPQESLDRLKRIYPAQDEAFILKRLKNADSAFQKWRSFPPYYYDLIARLSDDSKEFLEQRKGQCAGDAHLENFGYLFLKESVFTINDLDDASECSMNADAMRLFVGFRLISDITAKQFLDAYMSGINGNNSKPVPEYVNSLYEESQKEKRELHKKNKKMIQDKSCIEDYSKLSGHETKFLSEFVEEKDGRFIWGCTRTKESGGSAGIKRYIVFFQQDGHEVEGIELKPLINPSPHFNKKISSEERALMFVKGVEYFMGSGFKEYYYPVVLNEVLYQRKPLWKGNVAVSEKDLSKDDLKAVMLYEAHRLGTYHSKSPRSQVRVFSGEWEKVAQEVEAKWRKEFAE